MTFDDFLVTAAKKLFPQLTKGKREVFVAMLSDENEGKEEDKIAIELGITTATYKKNKGDVFEELLKINPDLKEVLPQKRDSHKTIRLREYYKEKYEEKKKYEEQQQQSSALDDQVINLWHARCSAMVANQQHLTSNRLSNGYEDAILQPQKIYVPLALDLRTKPNKHSSEFSSAAESSPYERQHEEKKREEKKRFEHDAFLTQILERGEGKTEGKRIALIGKPGAGKTTLLQRIAFWKLGEIELPRQQETKNLVFWISLAALKREQSIEKYLLEIVLKQALELPHTTPKDEFELAGLFKSGRVWLLLDGLDEMASDNPVEALKSQLTSWVAKAHVVLTCRQNIWQDVNPLTEEFETYELREFDYDQQNKFIDEWFCNSDPTVGKQLKAKLDTSEQWLRGFVQNPLMLWLLCFIWLRGEGKLPQTRFEFYHRVVKTVYDWNRKCFEITPQEQELNKALRCLAIWNIGEGDFRNQIRESKITDHLGLPNNKKSLFHLALKLGLLNNVEQKYDTGENVYAFFHPTFEEYFAAWEIDDWRFFLKHIPDNPYHPDASYRIFEPKWEEVILLWLGREDVSSKDKEEFIQALVEFDSGCGNFYARRAYFLAAKGIAEFKDCSRADEIVEQMVKWCLERDFRIQEELWEIFAVFLKTERTKAINGLIKITRESQSEYIRLQAAGNLGRIDQGNIIAIDALVTIIKNSQESFNFTQAAEILGEITKGNSTAIHTAIDALVEALVDLIQNSTQTSLNIAWGMARILGEIAKDNPEVVNTLEVLIRESQSEYIDFHAAESLVAINKGNIIANNTLVRLIRESQSENIPHNAANILEATAEGDPTVIHALVKLIPETQSEETLWHAARILGHIGSGNSTAIDALQTLIQESQSKKILWEAAFSLEKINKGNSIANNTLVNLIRNLQFEDPSMRVGLCLGLINSDNSEVINALIELIRNSQSEYMRRMAASGLGKSGLDNPEVIEALVESLQNSQDESFIWLIGRIFRETGERHPTIIHALESLAQNSQPEDIRLKAAESLIAINAGYSTVIDTLASLAQHSQSKNVRIDAAQSLVGIDPGNSIAINTLRSSAENYPSNDMRRHGMVMSLGRVSERAQIEEVLTKCKDYLSNRSSENDFQQHKHWYEITWRYAQTLPYPIFYQAWHPSPHTPDSQSLNLADLPKRLRAALDSDSSLEGEVQLICINGSYFLNSHRDNPALNIYNQMRSQSRREYWNGKPRDMSELQDYWDDITRDSDRTYILVFYESRIPLEGFHDNLLNDLRRFSGTICVISNQPSIPIPLLSFSPNQLNLVAKVVESVRNVVLENS